MITNYLKGMTLALATVVGMSTFSVAALGAENDNSTSVTVNGKVYNLGSNMMANGNLTDGFKGWTSADPSQTPYVYSDVTDTNFKIEEGAGPGETNALVSITGGAGSNKPASLRMPFEGTPGKTYYVSFDYKSCSDWTTVYNVATKDAGADSYAFRCTKSDEWKKAEVVIEVTTENPWIIFNAAWLDKDKSSFANFFIGEATVAGSLDNLKALINEATETATKASEKIGLFGNSKEAVDALNAAIATAQGVADKEGATDEECTAAIAALQAALDTFKESPILLPEKIEFAANTKVYVKYANKDIWYGLNWHEEKARLLYLDGAVDPSQQFTFTTPEGAAEGQYNIIDGKGNVVYCEGNWDIFWKASEGVTLTDPAYLFTIVNEDGKTFISSVKTGKVNASDGDWAWAPIYSDKAKDNKFAPVEFYSAEAAAEPEVNLTELNAQIKAAEDLLAAAVAGEEPGQYPQAAIDALTQAVAAAKEVVAKEDLTQAEADKALETLKTAVQTFKDAEIKPATGDLEQATEFLEDTYYYIRNEWSGLWYTAADNDSKTLALDELTEGSRNQQFKFMYVKNADGNNLITSDNRIVKQDSWNLNWATYVSGDDYNTAPYLYKVEREGNVYYVKSVGKLGYVAPDDNKAGSSLYSDKSVDFVDDNGVAKVPVTLWIAADAQDAVEGIAADAVEAVYYDLNGRMVNANSLEKGIYIKKEGMKATKIMIR